jgi:hypothetical protein
VARAPARWHPLPGVGNGSKRGHSFI